MKTKHPFKLRLGIDIGRVIIHGDGPDTSFVGAATTEEALAAPAVAGAFDAIARLAARLEGRVWLVSKCGPKVADRSRRWLAHHGFHEATGVREDRVRFCRERRDKALICVELGLAAFVDDRLDVLRAMSSEAVPLRLLFGASRSPDEGILAAPTWAEAEAVIADAADEEERTGARAPAAHRTWAR